MKDKRFLRWDKGGVFGKECDICGEPSNYALEYQDETGFDSEYIAGRCEEHWNEKTQTTKARKMRKKMGIKS